MTCLPVEQPCTNGLNNPYTGIGDATTRETTAWTTTT
jgi:hypothetical protein